MSFKMSRFKQNMGVFSAGALASCLAAATSLTLLACNNEPAELLAVEAPRVAYADSVLTFRKGLPSTQAPISTGGRVFRWSVSPALPAGLALDSLDGELSGTPLDTASAKAYTLTAKGPGGNGTFAFTLRVRFQDSVVTIIPE